MDEHTDSALAGEPAVLYIEGDLAATESLNGIRSLLRRLGDNPNLGHSEDGGVFPLQPHGIRLAAPGHRIRLRASTGI